MYFSRASEFDLQAQSSGRVVPKQLARADVAPQRSHRFMAALAHDGELGDPVFSRLRDVARTKAVAPDRARRFQVLPAPRRASEPLQPSLCSGRPMRDCHDGPRREREGRFQCRTPPSSGAAPPPGRFADPRQRECPPGVRRPPGRSSISEFGSRRPATWTSDRQSECRPVRSVGKPQQSQQE